MTDLVKQLRARAAAETGDETVFLTAIPNYMLHREAADEIEQLRIDLNEALLDVERLRAAGRQMRDSQRVYFKTRTREALIASKEAEAAFDKALRGET